MRLKTEPNYSAISDEDLIHLVAWCEKWKTKKVYDTAWKQVHMEPQHTFGDWMVYGKPKLPLPVRTELITAAKINYERGRMWSLQLYALIQRGFRLFLDQSFYAFLAFLLVYWIIK